jgi:hypothetical protein
MTEQEDGQDGPLFRATERNDPLAVSDLERA